MDNKYGRQTIPSVQKPANILQKYWGSITTVYGDENFALKKIFMKKGTQSSMEYHIKKEETYYIYSGKLKLGLRVGRAENKFIILEKNDIYHIPVGLMHMRMALEDTVIIEWSNGDDDEDSNIVEDGKKYKFPL